MPGRPLLLVAMLLVLAGGAPPAGAAVVEALFEASVPVDSQAVADRPRALRAALHEVLVKTSGRRDVAEFEGVDRMLDDASRLVQQFRYELRDSVDPETGEPLETMYLWARFNPVPIQRALAEHRVPLWGRERPAVLVWLAYDDGSERALVDDDAPPAIQEALTTTAERRGLPLVTPLMDLQDRAALGFAEVWGGFDDSIREASARYGSDAILVGRVFALGDERWGARWILFTDRTSRHSDSPAGSLESVVAHGPHWAADGFAERFSIIPDAAPDGRTRLTVAGIEDIGDYAGVLRYLESLSPVAGVFVEQVRGDAVVFALDLRGSREQLERAIALGSRLEAAPGEFDVVAGALRYTIRP